MALDLDHEIGVDRADDGEQLRRIPRRLGVAGGERKHSAIRAALLGHWVNVLVTDREEAGRLLADAPSHDAPLAAGGVGENG